MELASEWAKNGKAGFWREVWTGSSKRAVGPRVVLRDWPKKWCAGSFGSGSGIRAGGRENFRSFIFERTERLRARAAFWRQEFNDERPHESLGMQFLCEVYEPSAPSYAGPPDQLVYPGLASRRVKQAGTISDAGVPYFISTDLRGWDRGLTAVSEGRFEVRFADLVLGQIEPSSASFLPVVLPTRTLKS